MAETMTPETEARDLIMRLRGRYAMGPIMADGEPEFGYRIFDKVPALPDADGMMARPPIYEEAANAIEALSSALSAARREAEEARGRALEEARSAVRKLDLRAEDAWDEGYNTGLVEAAEAIAALRADTPRGEPDADDAEAERDRLRAENERLADAYAQGARDEQSRVQSILRGLEAKREEEGDSIRSGCYDLAALRTHSLDPGKSAALHASRAALAAPAAERDGEEGA